MCSEKKKHDKKRKLCVIVINTLQLACIVVCSVWCVCTTHVCMIPIKSAYKIVISHDPSNTLG